MLNLHLRNNVVTCMWIAMMDIAMMGDLHVGAIC